MLARAVRSLFWPGELQYIQRSVLRNAKPEGDNASIITALFLIRLGLQHQVRAGSSLYSATFLFHTIAGDS